MAPSANSCNPFTPTLTEKSIFKTWEKSIFKTLTERVEADGRINGKNNGKKVEKGSKMTRRNKI